MPAPETLPHATSKPPSTAQQPLAVPDPSPALQQSRGVKSDAPAEVKSAADQPQPGLHRSAPATGLEPAPKLLLSHAQHQPDGKQETSRNKLATQRQDAVSSKNAMSHKNAVRSKAVMILQLAFTGPFSLSPQEAAEGLEHAVFADFAEDGVPGNRSEWGLTAVSCLSCTCMCGA